MVKDAGFNLKRTAFNCQGFKYRNYNYVNEIFNKCNILMLQETWLYNFEHSNFINVNLSLSVSLITTTSNRICAVEFKSGNTKLMLINVYMPNDDNSDTN